MGLYLIDGLPGTGKTTTGKMLAARGYKVYDGDEDNLAHWYNDATGEQVAQEAEERTTEFVQAHSRNIDPDIVADLAARAANTTIFLTNDPENIADVVTFFDKQFALVLDETMRQQRLDTRTNNDWGKLPHEREYDLQVAAQVPELYAQFGHILLDASQPTDSIVDRILMFIE